MNPTKTLVLGGVALPATSAVASRRVARPWHERRSATDEELQSRLDGDELVAEPAEPPACHR